MTRSKSSGDLGTRTDRAKLQVRKESHWLVLEKGRALGYAMGDTRSLVYVDLESLPDDNYRCASVPTT
jgi:hypothetical protein